MISIFLFLCFISFLCVKVRNKKDITNSVELSKKGRVFNLLQSSCNCRDRAKEAERLAQFADTMNTMKWESLLLKALY